VKNPVIIPFIVPTITNSGNKYLAEGVPVKSKETISSCVIILLTDPKTLIPIIPNKCVFHMAYIKKTATNVPDIERINDGDKSEPVIIEPIMDFETPRMSPSIKPN